MQAAILAAEADREARIKRAEGEAEAILKVQQAEADGIRMLNESAPSKEVLTIRSLEAFKKAADGKATKLIIPSDLAGVAGLATSVTEAIKTAKE
jgi:regulator of protease activity HflC (stomatin/prohibitin superfamily)